MTKTVWRVLAWEPVHLMWMVHSEHSDKVTAQQHAEAMQHKEPRAKVRVSPASGKCIAIKPQINNETRKHREEQLAKQIELQDASKRYKSMG